ncbi:MAG: penicillin acylase family protein [Ekhidna sp.]|nr:penicillin acylase family protein [Ekhidna sp.]
MKKLLLSLLVTLLLLFIIGLIWLKNSNNFKRDGKFDISVNDSPIEIIRDEYGIAYVLADSKPDVIRGQGFVMAQDRLFQVEFYRALIKGEAAQLVGTSMLDSDIKMRVLNLYGNAERHFQYLDDETKEVLTWYCEGFNEYLRVGVDEYPLELTLLDIEPQPLKPVDILSVTHFIGLFHSQNMEDEVLSLNLAASTKDASELLPLSINLDRTKPLPSDTIPTLANLSSRTHPFLARSLPDPLLPYPKLGSNNWAISGERSKSPICN